MMLTMKLVAKSEKIKVNTFLGKMISETVEIINTGAYQKQRSLCPQTWLGVQQRLVEEGGIVESLDWMNAQTCLMARVRVLFVKHFIFATLVLRYQNVNGALILK